MLFAGLILVIGSGWIYYQQNRFRPVAFPSGDAIDDVRAELNDLEAGEPADADGAPERTTDGELNGIETLVVRVTGTAETVGKIRLAIYRSSENFNDSERADWKKGFSIETESSTTCQIPSDALADRFAIAAFHDVNDNGKLDRNAIGIPSERYGFSNQARGKFGPPTFDEAVIDLPKANEPIDLKIW